MVILSSPDNPVSRTREDIINVFFPVLIIGICDIPNSPVPDLDKNPVFRCKIPGPVRHPPCLFSLLAKNQDTGTEITAAEFRPAGMHRADTFMGCLPPEKRTGNGFFILLLLIAENVPFIRVHGYHTFLTIRVPNPEFIGIDLLPYTDNLTHGTATVTTALTYKGHYGASLLTSWFSGRKKYGVRVIVFSFVRNPDHFARYSTSRYDYSGGK
jgi:hypothetical protein